jgi:hypothetical protein
VLLVDNIHRFHLLAISQPAESFLLGLRLPDGCTASQLVVTGSFSYMSGMYDLQVSIGHFFLLVASLRLGGALGRLPAAFQMWRLTQLP